MISLAGKTRKHALAGNGPIVDRARAALRRVAEQFGEVSTATQTSVDVRTGDGLELSLSYDPGNYVFSRVYNLTISVALAATSTAPVGVKVSHRGPGGARYVNSGGEAASEAIVRLNEVACPHIKGIDLHSSTIAAVDSELVLTVTPLGGSYVWVLIPPVYKATSFPEGEPERILDLIRAIRGLGTEAIGQSDQ